MAVSIQLPAYAQCYIAIKTIVLLITIGIITLESCEIQRMIPIWILVVGVSGCLSLGLGIVKSFEELKDSKIIFYLHFLLHLFYFIWWICGKRII
jgi:hypothetical protein